MRFGLGIDTGGTYTDSVILDMDSGMTVCRSKALTTRDDLSKGINESVSGLDRSMLKDVVLVSLSSTLATNSVVEGKGCRVGLLTIGTGYDPAAAPEFYAEIGGKFDLSGNEVEELDEEGAKAALESMKGKVDAVAVAGYLSVRNPGHENAVRRLAHDILGVPAVCGHDLSSQLGFSQRTATAVMNARLIQVIADLIRSVKDSMKALGVDAPLMIVKGDGSVMGETSAAERPVETVLSGPASSLVGAMALTGLKDAMVVDMGGTTTDIGVIRGGFPRIEQEGALIGGYRTRVRAADISTYGIGGDSRIVVNGKETSVTPVRVIPICIAAAKWPHIKEKLEALKDVTDDRAAEAFDIRDVCQDTEFFVPAKPLSDEDLSECDRDLLKAITEGPLTLNEAGKLIGVPPHAFSASKMESLGLVTRIGVTPTDILHAEGTYTEYDTGASRIAVGYLARKTGMSFDGFIADTKAMIVRRIAYCIMEDIMRERLGRDELDEVHKTMISELLSTDRGCYTLSMKLDMPIIGIGGPVRAWLPAVADMLGTRLVLPEDSEMGNAIGAVTGSVSETVTVTVRAKQDDRSRDPECIVFTKGGKREFPDSESALEYAEKEAKDAAETMAREAGAGDTVIECKVEEVSSDTMGDGIRSFREARVTATATGKPDILSERLS